MSTKNKHCPSYRRNKHAAKERYYKATQIYSRRNWTTEEINLVLSHSMTDRELSEKIHRSMKSIQSKRYKLTKDLHK